MTFETKIFDGREILFDMENKNIMLPFFQHPNPSELTSTQTHTHTHQSGQQVPSVLDEKLETESV